MDKPITCEQAREAALCLDVLVIDPDYLPYDREAKALALVRALYQERRPQQDLWEFAYELWREIRRG